MEPEIEFVPHVAELDLPYETPKDLVDFRLTTAQRAIRGALHTLNGISPRAAAHLAAFLFLRPRRKPVTYTQNLPAGAQKLQIFYDVCALTAYSWGDGDKTVLMVHGWESHIGRMLPLVQPLVAAGFRVVALDSPGHGQSPRLLASMYDIGEAVRCALEQLNPVYAIIANSFGAAATMSMLARQPDVQPAKIALVSPMAHFNQHLDVFNRLVGVEGKLEANMRRVLANHLPVPLDSFDVAALIPSIRSQGMVIHDLYDPVIPFASSCRIAANWENATFVKTQGLGHKDLISNANLQSALVDFLTSSGEDINNHIPYVSI